MLRFLTSGESHGRCLTAILEGMIAGLPLSEEDINRDLARRQYGYGRGGRMRIEKDCVEIVSGLRRGATLGGPIALSIENKDYKIDVLPVVERPRPGHADLTGLLKYGRRDIRDILERASARETAARVAIGAICKKFLSSFGVDVMSHVVEIGGIKARPRTRSFEALQRLAERSPVRSADAAASKRMVRRIEAIKRLKNTVGGIFEVQVRGVVPGIGSYTQYDRRLNAVLAFALMSIQAVKGVEVGLGFEVARLLGSRVHDEIYYSRRNKRYYRKTNGAGGIEGGISNGENIILRAATKPYSTLMRPMRSVHTRTKRPELATVERSDVTAVPACGVVGEAMVAFSLAQLYLEKFGGDSLGETLRNFRGYARQVERF